MIKREWTTKDQSEILLNLGLDPRTSNTGNLNDISWSFLKLYTMMPTYINGVGRLSIVKNGNEVTEFRYGRDVIFGSDQPIDAAFEMMKWILGGCKIVYTSYYANIKNLPQHIFPISIAAKAPDGFKGPQFKVLAPKYDFFQIYKQTGDEEYYMREFNDKVLKNINPEEIYNRLKEICDNQYQIPCLICYEKPEDFCHRHLVADWLNKSNIITSEYYAITT